MTGAGGFLGSWMVRALHEWEVIVTATDLASRRVQTVADLPRVRSRSLDIRNRDRVMELVAEERPDLVYHFAGQAFVSPSWSDPVGTFDTNCVGTLNVLEALRVYAPAARVALAGSGTRYGDPEIVPTPESSPYNPGSPYAASKATADLIGHYYYSVFGLSVFRYRIFGTTGPGKRGDSANDFASQIAAAERSGRPSTIRVGNLDRERDVSDVRDAIRAMITVVESGVPGEAYNIGSGVPRKVADVLALLESESRVAITHATDERLVRKVDEPRHLADVSKIRQLGWSTTIPFEQTLHDVLDYWRTFDAAGPTGFAAGG